MANEYYSFKNIPPNDNVYTVTYQKRDYGKIHFLISYLMKIVLTIYEKKQNEL